MATIREVAHHAKVSAITVSRAVNHPDSVSPRTLARVQKAIAELRYVPNMIGQSLRNNQTMVIALVVSDITNPFAIQQIRGVGDAAREHGYTVIFTHTDSSHSLELEQLRALVERRVDGIILSPVTNQPDSVDFVQGQNLPIAVLGYPMPHNDVDVVRCDTRTASREMTDYLLELGHCKLAMLSGPREIVTARERAQGFAASLKGAGLEALSVRYGAFSIESGYRMAHTTLSTGERPTALVTANNFIAIGAAQAARDLGIRVPEDLSIVTFDNSGTDSVLDPFFTGVIQPVAETASMATRQLLDRIVDGYSGPGRDVVLPTRFEIHESARPPE